MKRLRHMRAGALRQIVTIEQPPTTSDGMGGVTGNWTAFASNVPAAIEPLNGRELFGGEQVQFRATHNVTIRYNPSLIPTTAMRVVFETRLLHIQAIIDADERHQWATLVCEERAQQ